ncbi:hypothetical protein DSECCO2_532920 [anaerobic digester metagenome]
MSGKNSLEGKLLNFLNGLQEKFTVRFQNDIEIIIKRIVVVADLVINHFIMRKVGTE